MKCLICHSDFHIPLTINHLFAKPDCVCEECIQKWKIEQTKRCKRCRRRVPEEENECIDCNWLRNYFKALDFGKIGGLDIISDYNDDVKNMIHHYKSDGDILIAEAIAEIMLLHYPKSYFKKFDYVIPVPSSQKRIEERGFHPVKEVLEAAGIHYDDILTSEFRIKQSGMSKSERIKQDNPFDIKNKIRENTSILLIDDIYTTGLTMHHAASVILNYKVSNIRMLAFARP